MSAIDVLRRFQGQWQLNRRPSLSLALKALLAYPDHVKEAFRLVNIELRYRLASGDDPPLTDILGQLAAAGVQLNVEDILELACREYGFRWARGDTDTRKAEYSCAFPALADQINEWSPIWTCPTCGAENVSPDEESNFVTCRQRQCQRAFPVHDVFPPAAKHLDLRQYDLIEELGAGGMGRVYRSRDRSLQRDVAIKILHPKLAGHKEAEARFEREARILGYLQHPNIVPVHNFGRLNDCLFYSMKLVKGETFESCLSGLNRNVDKQLDDCLGIFGKVCQATAFAHQRGVIHRDLKPSNVMVGNHGEVQIMDWGLAKWVVAAEAVSNVEPFGADADVCLRSFSTTDAAEEDQSQTRHGQLLGTLLYMPPEQARSAADADKRSDVFALGAILCEILTGAPPSLELDEYRQLRELRQAYLRFEKLPGKTTTSPTDTEGEFQKREEALRASALQLSAYYAGLQLDHRAKDSHCCTAPGLRRLEALRAAALNSTTSSIKLDDGPITNNPLRTHLIPLAKDCLRSSPSDRPPDAGDVERRLEAYGVAVQSAAKERSIADVKRRRTQVVAALAVLLAVVAIGAALRINQANKSLERQTQVAKNEARRAEQANESLEAQTQVAKNEARRAEEAAASRFRDAGQAEVSAGHFLRALPFLTESLRLSESFDTQSNRNRASTVDRIKLDLMATLSPQLSNLQQLPVSNPSIHRVGESSQFLIGGGEQALLWNKNSGQFQLFDNSAAMVGTGHSDPISYTAQLRQDPNTVSVVVRRILDQQTIFEAAVPSPPKDPPLSTSDVVVAGISSDGTKAAVVLLKYQGLFVFQMGHEQPVYVQQYCDRLGGKDENAEKMEIAEIKRLQFSSDGERLLVDLTSEYTSDPFARDVGARPPDNGKIAGYVIDLKSNTERPIVGHELIRFSPRGDFVAYQDAAGAIWLQDLSMGDDKRVTIGCPRHPVFMEFDPRSRYLLTSSDDGIFEQWATGRVADHESGELYNRVLLRRPARKLAFSEDASMVAVGAWGSAEDSFAQVFSDDLEEILTPALPHRGPIALILEDDGSEIITATNDGILRQWNLRTQMAERIARTRSKVPEVPPLYPDLIVHQRSKQGFQVARQRLSVDANPNQNYYVYDDQNQLRFEIKHNDSLDDVGVYSMQFSPGGGSLVASEKGTGDVLIWSLTQNNVSRPDRFTGNMRIKDFAFLENEKHLVAWDPTTAVVFERHNDKFVHVTDIHLHSVPPYSTSDNIELCAVLPDSRLAAVINRTDPQSGLFRSEIALIEFQDAPRVVATSGPLETDGGSFEVLSAPNGNWLITVRSRKTDDESTQHLIKAWQVDDGVHETWSWTLNGWPLHKHFVTGEHGELRFLAMTEANLVYQTLSETASDYRMRQFGVGFIDSAQFLSRSSLLLTQDFQNRYQLIDLEFGSALFPMHFRWNGGCPDLSDVHLKLEGATELLSDFGSCDEIASIELAPSNLTLEELLDSTKLLSGREISDNGDAVYLDPPQLVALWKKLQVPATTKSN